MADIESLDISLDVSDRKRFYDYRHSALVQEPKPASDKQPEGQGVILQGCCESHDAYELRTYQITTNHVWDKGFFEKFAPSKGAKDVDVFNMFANANRTNSGEDVLPCSLLPVYHPGDVVRGTIILSLKSNLSAEKLTLNLRGLTTVNKRIRHSRGYHDNKGYETYMDETLILWRASNVKPGGNEQFLVDKDLVEGVHPFHFEFRIPETANASISPLVTTGDDYAYNVYRLKVKAHRGKTFGRGNSVTCRGIWIERPVNAADFREKLSPSIAEKTLRVGGCFYAASGDIRCQVTVPKTVFARNETVPVSVDVENNTPWSIDNVSARIRLRGRAKTGTMKISFWNSFKHFGVGRKAGPVRRNDSVNYKFDITFDFSHSFLDTCVIPVSEASDLSKLITFKYEVYVIVQRRKPNKDMELAIPITVCTDGEGGEPVSAF